jgi:serine/threonine protein phosphatase PrpC
MSFLPANAQHIGNRSSQQDSFGFGDLDDEAFISHGGFVAVVCDGMGGMEHGDHASRTAVRAFLEGYARKTPQETIPAALERSVRDANAQVVEMAHELGAAESVGTTLVAAVLVDSDDRGKGIYFISVGDSGLFHISDGQIQTVNRPHVFANVLDTAVTRGAMSREQALLHPERESLTSFIGVDVLDEIDRNIDPWPLSDGDTILLASDGLFKTLSAEEILESLTGHPQRWPDALVARTLAQRYEYQDNVTVLSVTVQDRPDTLKLPPPAVAIGKNTSQTTTVILPPQRKPKSRRMLASALIFGLVLGAAAGGGRWWYKRHHQTAVTERK